MFERFTQHKHHIAVMKGWSIRCRVYMSRSLTLWKTGCLLPSKAARGEIKGENRGSNFTLTLKSLEPETVLSFPRCIFISSCT